MKLYRELSPRALLLVPVLALLAACGTPAAAQQEPPTPTPLPPAPELERPTYTVERGVIEDVLEINGRVTPVDLVRLPFRRAGRVERVNVKRGDRVQQGAVLAELQQDDQLDELRQAENALKQAQRALEDAQKAREKQIKQAQLELETAQKALARVLPGGPDDPIRKAQKELEAARRAAEENKATASTSKTDKEYALLKATEALQDAQDAYSTAWWDNDWVQRYGTDPNDQGSETETISGTTKIKPRKLTDREKKEFKDKLVDAERALREAERGVAQAQRDLEQARAAEIRDVADEDDKVQEAQRVLDELINGEGNEDLIARRNAVEQARLALEEAQQGSLDDEMTQVENAQASLAKARKAVQDGQIIAPQDGQILALSVGEGDEIKEFEPVIELADPSKLEIAAELSGEQMRKLSEGQPVQVSLLSRPDVLMPAVIRQMPAPYGAGGSGAITEQDKTTRFQISDTMGQALQPGAVAKIQIVLEKKENVLLLPPDAIRSFEGRKFVVVRKGARESRVPVRLGIQTEERVQILEDDPVVDTLKEGDVVVGQ